MTQQKSTPEHFWSRVDSSSGPFSCWPWMGARKETGYGRVKYHGKTFTAHRLAFILKFGVEPDCVLHECDHPWCCNPDHLFSGTRAENMLDMDIKGRRKTVSGDSNGATRIKTSDYPKVNAMLSEGLSFKQIAEELGVHLTTVWRKFRMPAKKARIRFGGNND